MPEAPALPLPLHLNELFLVFMLMKLPSKCFLGFCMLIASLVFAQQAEKKVIPEEESSPPFEVGQLADKAGYDIKLAEGGFINFRFVKGKMRVYFFDEDRLVIEPTSTSGNVRFNKTVGGKKFYALSPIDGDVALGNYEFIPYPHTYSLVLNLKDTETGKLQTNAFRYVQRMNEAPVDAE